MSTYKDFQTNPEMESNGIVLDFGTSGKFTVARAGGANQKFQKRINVLTKPHRVAINAGTIDPKIVEACLIEAYVDTVILGWDGVTDENDQALPFNKKNGIKLFTDLPDLFNKIIDLSQRASLYRQSLNEDDAKNL